MKIRKKGIVTSIDGNKQISLEKFDHIADSGSDEIDEYLDWSKSKRGGARPGAGRKRKKSVRLEVMIRPDLREKIRERAKQKGITQVEVIELAIESL